MNTVTNEPGSAARNGRQLSFRVMGMNCAGCASSVERAVRRSDEHVQSCSVSYSLGRAIVKGDELDADQIISAIRSAGFDAEPLVDRASLAEARRTFEHRQQTVERQWRNRAFIALSLWAPMELLHWGGHMVGLHGPWMPWVMAVGSTIALATAGGGFYSSALKAARHRTTNMDTLIAIGTTAAWCFSMVVLLSQVFGRPLDQPLYFAEVAALLGIISLGHWLEARSSNKANSAVRELLDLQPDEAERLPSADSDDSATVPVPDVMPGDVLLIRPGSRIAVDGIVLRGESEVDESLVTGEPIPALRQPGDDVIAGSMNTTGRLVIEASVDGSSTTVARIAEMVGDAQSSKAEIQKLADRVCAIFVPSVITIALVTFLGWWLLMGDSAMGVIAAVTVLIISCPCALGLATPLAVMVGTGEASRSGLLIKSAAVLETAARVQHVIFDKTGTLTVGRPSLAGIDLIPDERDALARFDEDEALRIAASVERPSEHPIAQAIVNAAEQRGLLLERVELFQTLPGRGVQGMVGNFNVEVLRDERASCRLIIDGQPVALLHITDAARPDARTAIEQLQQLGMAVTMLSGDRQETAERIGDELGLATSEVQADTTPQQKLEFVQQAMADAERNAEGQRTRPRIAMVGDGINDAAALAAADVGITMASGTSIAMESADVVVLNDQLGSVPRTIHLARRTLRTIRQNLFFAFIYNATAIPVAALGLLGMYGPLWAALAMALSDISVVGNALRLKHTLARERRRL